jgi:hypothetical protein
VSALKWFVSLWAWLTTPAVLPWAGGVAAIVAAMTVQTKTWLQSPRASLERAVRVATVWLLVAWLLSIGGHLGAGRGSGTEGEGPGLGSGKGERTVPATPLVSVGPGTLPAGTAANVVLLIRFVPAVTNQASAKYFSCDLIRKAAEKGPKIELRARNGDEFARLLGQQLRELSWPPDVERPVVRILKTPWPGEGVLRRVREQVLTVLPQVTVEFDEEG